MLPFDAAIIATRWRQSPSADFSWAPLSVWMTPPTHTCTHYKPHRSETVTKCFFCFFPRRLKHSTFKPELEKICTFVFILPLFITMLFAALPGFVFAFNPLPFLSKSFSTLILKMLFHVWNASLSAWVLIILPLCLLCFSVLMIAESI